MMEAEKGVRGRLGVGSANAGDILTLGICLGSSLCMIARLKRRRRFVRVFAV